MDTYRFYVYAYIRLDGTPYYIGKGSLKRAYQPHRVKVPPHNRIIFLEQNLSEIGALALERRYIRWFGRKDNDSGILRNMTDGGENCIGHIKSELTRSKISQALSGRVIKSETKSKLSKSMTGKKIRLGATLPDESRKKISNSLLGKPVWNAGKTGIYSKETKQKMKVAGCMRISCIHCQTETNLGNYNRWHGANCKKFTPS